ncbi:MAG TPA: methylated-DNA--[protein]-cysteine S-methyltransferase [Thermoanaerobaculia bacterium]|nr:methylated-DNA--[protein]-cysteine S-methyltransferase [Thermoanaerobaculia bacterium]
MTVHAVFDTPFGVALAAAREGRLAALGFFDDEAGARAALGAGELAPDAAPFPLLRRQLAEYFAAQRTAFELPLAPAGSPFQRRVWEALLAIPYGRTRSYGELAAAVGRPGAARAVGRANHDNPIGVVIPCHRVIAAGGALTGYAGGLHRKRYLLELEGALPRSLAFAT